MHGNRSEYSITIYYYLLYQIIKKKYSGNQTLKNLLLDVQKYHIRAKMSHQNQLYQVRANMNFAMKQNVQTDLNNDKYNNPKSDNIQTYNPMIFFVFS